MINIKNLDSDLPKIDKKSCKNIDIYYVGYITIKNIGAYESIHSINALYLIIYKVDGYIEENEGKTYLIFASTGKSKEVLTKYTELWYGIKNWIEKINYKPGKNGKDLIKINFNSHDNLSLNKLVKLHN